VEEGEEIVLDEFYTYGEFVFKREQILWALRNAELFKEGKWPPQNVETGYTDLIRRKGVKREPSFVKPEIVIAEIDWRLEQTGGMSDIGAEIGWRLEHTGAGRQGLHIDARLLLAEVDAGYEQFSDEAWAVLNYISGWKRKKSDYVDFKKQRKYRRKGEYMRLGGKPNLTKIQIQERAKRKRNRRR